MNYFAGFYCTPSELAENARAERIASIVIAIAAIAYVLLVRWVHDKKRNMPRGGRLAVNILTPIISLILILFALLIYTFAGPNWCGNG